MTNGDEQIAFDCALIFEPKVTILSEQRLLNKIVIDWFIDQATVDEIDELSLKIPDLMENIVAQRLIGSLQFAFILP